MDAFHYERGRLRCEDVDATDLAARFGTPLYVYSARTLREHLQRLRDAFAPIRPRVCFSVKSCSNVHVLRALADGGAGMDVVSGGEIERAFVAGVPMDAIVYAGVGKSDAELRAALSGEHSLLPREMWGSRYPDPRGRGPIHRFNVESAEEFERISAIAAELGVRTRAALRINPDVTSGSHVFTDTGVGETKFGIDHARVPAFFERYGRDPHVELDGLHMHIGSPVARPEPYVLAIARALSLVDGIEAAGFPIRSLNIGGGFAADYETGESPSAAEYAAAINPLLKPRVDLGLEVAMEPGRTIVGNAGVLLTRVLYTKPAGGRLDGRRFAICDAGMHTLVRPALYDAFHFVWPSIVDPSMEPAGRGPDVRATDATHIDLVGPICECSDVLATDRALPPVASGDVLAVFTAGAYGMSMASNYNTNPLPAEVWVDGDSARLIRLRQTMDDLIGPELDAAEQE